MAPGGGLQHARPQRRAESRVPHSEAMVHWMALASGQCFHNGKEVGFGIGLGSRQRAPSTVRESATAPGEGSAWLCARACTCSPIDGA